MIDTFVIVGAGLAGAKAAEALREKGFHDRLVLIGDERHRPYERPPLSKSYLAGKADRESLFVHAEGWYADNGVELSTGVGVSAIDRVAHRVVLADGSAMNYTKLLLATGSSPRTVATPGINADNVHYLRRLDDTDTLSKVLAGSERLLLIGAGWIGLEVAAAARAAGVAVTIVESAELPLLRVLGPEVAAIFAALHRDNGVDLRFSSSIAEIIGTAGRANGVRLQDGAVIEADAILVAVGASPNTQLAFDAGLRVENGIVVDAGLRSTDADILAAGDVANAFHPILGRQIRVEHWANALHQPAVAAASMLGITANYLELPYFYTDQYDLAMEYVGYVEPGGYDEVVLRGDADAHEFIAFWLKDRQILAGMAVNTWDVIDPIRTMIRAGTVVDPTQLVHGDFPVE